MKLGTGFRDPVSMGAAGGAIGAGLAALVAGRKMKQIAEKKKQLDESNLDQLRALANADKSSFAAKPDEMSDLTLDPPSWFLGVMLSGTEHAGILRFRHKQKGKFKLELFGGDDARTAFLELPKALGDQIVVNAEWSDKKNRLVKV